MPRLQTFVHFLFLRSQMKLSPLGVYFVFHVKFPLVVSKHLLHPTLISDFLIFFFRSPLTRGVVCFGVLNVFAFFYFDGFPKFLFLAPDRRHRLALFSLSLVPVCFCYSVHGMRFASAPHGSPPLFFLLSRFAFLRCFTCGNGGETLSVPPT